MREWTIKLFMIDDQGNEHPADCFNKVVYHLHPSFENPDQSECSRPPRPHRPARADPAAFTKPPFACHNEGWGEFEMDIDCYYTEKTKLTLKHDLNFMQNRYESVQGVSFKNPSQALQERLRELGPLPDDDARPKKKGVAGRKSGAQKYDFEKIAEALEKLEEDDLLKIIQMINDYKSPDTYIKSDVEGECGFVWDLPEADHALLSCASFLCSRPVLMVYDILIVDTLLEAGEFSIDLYTMPDILTKMLWDHLVSGSAVGAWTVSDGDVAQEGPNRLGGGVSGGASGVHGELRLEP